MDVRPSLSRFGRALVRRRTCWLPTWRGWGLAGVLGIALVVAVAANLHPFLAVTRQAHGGVLVVEGWLPDYALEEAVREFERHGYARLYVTGTPLEQGSHLLHYKTYADLGAATLLRLGLEPAAVQAVPAPSVRADRTYASAVTLKRWFDRHQVPPTRCHVLSLGPHARRTRLLFQRALGPAVRVGVTAIEPRHYQPRRWWRSSEGVRVTLDETIAYAYARLVFRASQETVPVATAPGP
ncbi:MAG: YdcF family protein [Verrucomicrobia bacterium]|nr:YdcF family protein [Verrucomicrobiota bacterium]